MAHNPSGTACGQGGRQMQEKRGASWHEGQHPVWEGLEGSEGGRAEDRGGVRHETFEGHCS